MWPFGGRFFPGTNLQDLNLDWIVQRVRDLSRGIIAPFINSANQHWMVWDTDAETFVDSGVSAAGEGTDAVTKALKGKTVAILGDSNAALWRQHFANPFKDYGAECYNYGVGGARFATSESNNIEAQFNTMLQSGVTPDYIIIWAGGNDIAAHAPNFGNPAFGTYTAPVDTTTFESARWLLYQIRTAYPAAQIVGVIRNYFNPAIYDPKLTDFFFGTLSLLYNSWQIPCYIVEGVDNMQTEIDDSKNLYYADERHYTRAAYTRFNNSIANFLASSPLSGHAVIPPHNLYAPTTITTLDAAISWAASFLGGYGSFNWRFPRGGFNLVYGNVSVNISVLGDDTIICKTGKGLAYYDGIAYGSFYQHKLANDAEIIANTDSLMLLPSGFVTFRFNALNENTVGMPSALGTMLSACNGVIIGSWQNNGYYKGMMLILSGSDTSPEAIPTGIGGNLVFISYAPSNKTWTFFTPSGNKWQQAVT